MPRNKSTAAREGTFKAFFVHSQNKEKEKKNQKKGMEKGNKATNRKQKYML